MHDPRNLRQATAIVFLASVSCSSLAYAETVVVNGNSTKVIGDAGGPYESGQSLNAPNTTLPDNDIKEVGVTGGKGGSDSGAGTQAGEGGYITGTAQITVDGTEATDTVKYKAAGGNGGNATSAGADGGDGGKVLDTHFIVTGDNKGSVTVEIIGGNGGSSLNGESGTPGSTGQTTGVVESGAELKNLIVTSGAGVSNGTGSNVKTADGGDIILEVEEGASVNSLLVITRGSANTDPTVAGGHGGDVDVTINGTVNNGSFSSTSEGGALPGNIKVTLGDGAVVTGRLTASGNGSRTLVFTMHSTTSQMAANLASLQAAQQAIANGETSGTVVINGQPYRFENFSELMNMLQEDAAPDPTDDPEEPGKPKPPLLEVFLDSAPQPAPTASPAPLTDAFCKTHDRTYNVTATQLPGNSVQINVDPDRAAKRDDVFTLGTVARNAFVGNDGNLLLDDQSRPLPYIQNGWMAEVRGERKGKLVIDVIDPRGIVAARCFAPLLQTADVAGR